MSDTLKDGRGRGYLAEVTQQHKLVTQSTVLQNVYSASVEIGQAYVLTTDFLTISDTVNFSAIIYFKNASNTEHIHLEMIKAAQDVMTYWQFKRNPTSGTIISTADPANVTNINFVSNNVADINAYQGFNGATINGTSAANWIENAGGIPLTMGGAIILGPQDSVGFACKPSAAATINMSLLIYYDEIPLL